MEKTAEEYDTQMLKKRIREQEITINRMESILQDLKDRLQDKGELVCGRPGCAAIDEDGIDEEGFCSCCGLWVCDDCTELGYNTQSGCKAEPPQEDHEEPPATKRSKTE